jgi:hypothetical protein
MRRTHHLVAGLLLAAVVSLALPAGARAQFRYGDGAAAGYAYGRTQGYADAAVVNRARDFRYSPYNGGAFGYGNNIFTQTPANGFLTGAADVMSATGQYEIQHQQANLTNQQVKSAHIDNRRKMFDELKYEKENTPPLSANDEAARREQVAQMYHAQLSEVWSATALNVLLEDIRVIQRQTGLQGAQVPLDPDMVKHISLTNGSNTGSSTMLNNGGKLKWPPELDDTRFDASRKNIEKLFAQATQEAGGDGLSGRTQRALRTALDDLQDQIDKAIDDMTPTENIHARSWAKQVQKTAGMLSDPSVANQINGKWAPRGNTVAELINNMNTDGLKFGPAAPDSKNYYTSLYQALVQYDSSLQAMTRSSGSPGNTP